MAARGRKQKACPLRWNLREMLETHLAGKATKKRQNFDPSTPPAWAEHHHFTFNGETKRAPRPPNTCTKMLDILTWTSFVLLYVPLWRDNYRTTSEAPSPGLEAEGRRLKFHCIWTCRVFFIIILFYFILFFYFFSFIYLLIFYFYSYLYSFYFLFSICLSNAFSR
jgi:hypothetical protein